MERYRSGGLDKVGVPTANKSGKQDDLSAVELDFGDGDNGLGGFYSDDEDAGT